MSKLTKHQAKELKKKKKNKKIEAQRRKIQSQRKIRRLTKYIGIIVIFSVALLIVKGSMGAVEGAPSLQVSPESINLGDVSVSGGPVVVGFEIKNTGASDLVIDDMETSCGCTSASIVYDGVEGPLFNMREHGNNPVGWSVSIRPGDTAILKVIYDPMVHPDLRGTVTRVVTLYTNDPTSKVKDVYIRINQVD